MPGDARLARGLDQLVVGLRADFEVRVAVDHRGAQRLAAGAAGPSSRLGNERRRLERRDTQRRQQPWALAGI